MSKLWEEIEIERKAQDEVWGGPEHDDDLTVSDWIALVCKHAGKAFMFPFDGRKFRRQMIRVAAIAVAAIQSYDRAGEEDKSQN